MRAIFSAASLLVSLSFALPATAGDAAEGRAVFEVKCARCHSLDPSVSGLRGPHLARLFERRYGAVEGFYYRMIWKDANPRWTREHLNNYLEIHGLLETEERANLIDFLFDATRE